MKEKVNYLFGSLNPIAPPTIPKIPARFPKVNIPKISDQIAPFFTVAGFFILFEAILNNKPIINNPIATAERITNKNTAASSLDISPLVSPAPERIIIDIIIAIKNTNPAPMKLSIAEMNASDDPVLLSIFLLGF